MQSTLVRLALTLAVALVALAGKPRHAAAYPQYQLARDQTCTGCHIAPDGSNILNENGRNVAESTAWHPGDSSWLHLGDKTLPSWLAMGGDVRFAAGLVDPGSVSGDAYPMQVEVGAHATLPSGFSVTALGGLRSPKEGGSALHVLWSRQHYVMWQSDPGTNEGIYVRLGRLLPTYGLRLAEHVAYTQRFGGEQLYDEAYALAAAYVTSAFEVHATGFMHDRWDITTEKGDGGALYGEVRLGEHAAVGVEGKYSSSTDVKSTYGGLTGKLYLPSADLQLQAEVELIGQHLAAGDKYKQIAAYVLGSHPLGFGGLLLDVGLGHFTQDTRVKGLFRDCLDANLHWFWTSHTELLLTTRLELLDFGGSPTGGYALAQIHYRL